MLKLIKIETFKLFKRTKTWVILIAFILLTSLIGYMSYRDAKKMRGYYGTEAQLANERERLKWLEESRESIPDEIKNNEALVEEYKKSYDHDIESAKVEIARLKTLLQLEKAGDWQNILKKQVEELKAQQEMYKGQSDYKDILAQTEQEIDKLQYLLDNNIRPETNYDYNGRIFLAGIIAILGEIFLAMGIAVFAADMVSGEATPPTLKLLLTQPVSRAKVILSKFISINISAVSLIIGVELIGFLIVGLFCGFGNMKYPMTVGVKYMYDPSILSSGYKQVIPVLGSGELIPAWQYLVKLLLLQALFIIVCTSLVFLISTLVKASMVSMGISVVSIIASYVVFLGFNGLKNIAKYVFVLFGNVERLLTGDVAQMFDNPDINLNSTVIMFIVWIVVSYILSHITFTKKDILI
ncbi:MAG: ABC transporter permease subunit [Clostridiales bacterium]|nr:ABC transporter permease subunit [Clostridiales bacterium]